MYSKHLGICIVHGFWINPDLTYSAVFLPLLYFQLLFKCSPLIIEYVKLQPCKQPRINEG